MTEEEAKTKWCPRAVASHTNPRGKVEWDHEGQPIDAPRFQHNCIGSACMAWRWNDRAPRETMRLPLKTEEIDGEPVVRAGSLRIIKGESWRYEYTDADADGEFELLHRAPKGDVAKTGYCGLAGKP